MNRVIIMDRWLMLYSKQFKHEWYDGIYSNIDFRFSAFLPSEYMLNDVFVKNIPFFYENPSHSPHFIILIGWFWLFILLPFSNNIFVTNIDNNIPVVICCWLKWMNFAIIIIHKSENCFLNGKCWAFESKTKNVSRIWRIEKRQSLFA